MDTNAQNLLKQQIREQQKKLFECIKAERDNCPHMAGCNPLGLTHMNFTSIVWHFLDALKISIGLCTVCQREFRPEDPDYQFWRRKQSFNVPSSTGDQMGIRVTKDEYAEGSAQQFCCLNDSPAKEKTLDDLSDTELKDLLEQTYMARRIQMGKEL